MRWAPISTDERRDVRLTAEVEAPLSSPSAPSSNASLGYDAQNRVKTTTTADGVITTYAYFADDLLRETAATNVLTETRTYDKAGRLKTLTNTAGATAVSSYAYDYDANGNRIGQVETLASVAESPSVGNPVEATSYTYDAANRLKSVTYPPDATYPNGRTVTYGYDKVGNREREVETTTAGEAMLERAGVFDENNRLTSLTTTVAPPTVPPSYVPPTDVTAASVEAHVNSTLAIGHDPNGNEITRIRTVVDPVDGVSITLTRSIWDMQDRLVEQTRPVAEGNEGSGVEATGTIARHEYDADGRRTKKIGEDGARQYVYDDTSILAEYDTNGLEVAKYDYGADRLIRLTRADEGTRYMSFDGLGSVTGLTNEAGALAASYHLDAWGNYRFTGELTTSHNRFGYTGHYWDKEASLYYAKARYYDPFTARFTQSDSFLGNIDDPPSLHRYFYAHANPTMYADEDGHSATVVGTVAGFGWGLGQAIGRYWDDTMRGDYRRGFGDYASIVAQNTIAGAEIGASVDIGFATAPLSLTPGVGAATRGLVGGLVGAGVNSLTFAGGDGNWSSFAENQVVGAGVGAAVGVVPELGVGLAAYGAYEGYKTAQAGAPEVGYTQMALSIAPFFSKEVRNLSFGRMRTVVSEQILPRLNPFNYELARPSATTSMFGAGQGPKFVAPSKGVGRGINLLDARVGGRSFRPERPTWLASEQFFENQLSEFGATGQRSFVSGETVSRGTSGSVRPDLMVNSQKLSVDVKNYNFTTARGRYGAQRDVLSQLGDRAIHLPPGTRQGIILDARGQRVSRARMEALATRLVAKSKGLLSRDDIHIQW